MALSEERRSARVFVLRHAAAWVMEMETSELLDDSNGEWDPAKVAEARSVAKRLEAMAARLESKS